MSFSIGKVKEYNGISGTIVTPEDSYLFLDSDIDNSVNVGDLVKFRAEEINEIKRAFFVKPYSENTLDRNSNKDKANSSFIKSTNFTYEKNRNLK